MTALKNALATARDYAGRIIHELNKAMSVALTLEESLVGVKVSEYPLELNREQVNMILKTDQTIFSRDIEYLKHHN